MRLKSGLSLRTRSGNHAYALYATGIQQWLYVKSTLDHIESISYVPLHSTVNSILCYDFHYNHIDSQILTVDDLDFMLTITVFLA